MLAGELYDAYDAELLKDLNAVKVLCQQYNNLLPTPSLPVIRAK